MGHKRARARALSATHARTRARAHVRAPARTQTGRWLTGAGLAPLGGGGRAYESLGSRPPCSHTPAGLAPRASQGWGGGRRGKYTA